MTDMMVKMTQNAETQRSNRANERETQRSNRAREKETWRSNTTKEAETARSNREKEKLQRQANVASLLGSAAKGAETAGKLFAMANDPEWYLDGDKDYILGTVPTNFGNPLGPVDTVATSGSLAGDKIVLHPGVMGLDICLAYGIAGGNYSDPINKAAKTLYTKVQQNTSYRKSYQPNDMMMYLLAFDSLFAMISAAKRAIGLVGISSTVNRYVSKLYVQASGFDYDDLVKNLADYRKELNSLIALTRDFNIPHLYIYDRHQQLFSSVYLDYADEKSQAYITRLSGVYKYALVEKADQVTVGELQLVHPSVAYGRTIKMSTWLTTIREFYNAFANNQDFSDISGDMGKTFTDVFICDTIPDNYTVVPGRVDIVLQQIRNATVVPIPNPVGFGVVTQDTTGTGYITSFINYSSADTSFKLQQYPQEAFLGYWFGESITRELVMDTSRLIHFASYRTELVDGGTKTWYDIKECGSDIVEQLYIYVYGSGSDKNDVPSVDIVPGLITNTISSEDMVRKISNLAQFDNHPQVWITNDATAMGYPVWDFDNYRKFTRTDFAYMNEAALRSLLGANK